MVETWLQVVAWILAEQVQLSGARLAYVDAHLVIYDDEYDDETGLPMAFGAAHSRLGHKSDI